MRKITTPQGTIIVDESNICKTGELYLSSIKLNIKQKCEGVIQAGDKILASSFFISKDIPMFVIEDEVEKLANTHIKILYRNANAKTKQHPVFTDFTVAETSKEDFKEGYKSSQQKNVYSEADLRKAISKAVRAIDPVILGSAYYILEENKIIRSIKESIEFEMESDTTEIDNCNKFNLEIGCILPNCKCENSDLQRIKTITDSEGQKWWYLKQK